MRTGARGLRGVLMRRMGGERYLQPRRRHGARISCSCTLAVCHPSSRPHCTAAAVPPAPHSPIIRLHDARTTARRCRNRAELETNYHHFTARSSCRSRSWSNVNRRHHNLAPSVNPNCRMSRRDPHGSDVPCSKGARFFSPSSMTICRPLRASRLCPFPQGVALGWYIAPLQGFHQLCRESFVGNFVAFGTCCRFFLTEARRHRGTENRNREWTPIHANEFGGAAWRGTAKIAKQWSKRGE
jgi:hypothetical protein